MGWGATPGGLLTCWQPEKEWRSTARELKELLTEPEFASARASTPNAHYTFHGLLDEVEQRTDAPSHAGFIARNEAGSRKIVEVVPCPFHA